MSLPTKQPGAKAELSSLEGLKSSRHGLERIDGTLQAWLAIISRLVNGTR